jgi:hypothetical protein
MLLFVLRLEYADCDDTPFSGIKIITLQTRLIVNTKSYFEINLPTTNFECIFIKIIKLLKVFFRHNHCFLDRDQLFKDFIDYSDL